MSQAFNAEGVPLFACTKCNSRHPFEDLSQGHQLCKDCKVTFQVVKCNYCRSEYHQEGVVKSNSICKKCEKLQDQHGKPGPCAYCNIIAAFIGTKCQRCTNSEKKYGPPLSCEHCKQKCAFDRRDPESKKKVDGKLLCWLCTMAYKRTLAKARQKDAILKSSSGTGSHHHLNSTDSKSYSSSRHHTISINEAQKSSSRPAVNAPGGPGSSLYARSSSRNPQQNSSHSSSNHRESSSTSSGKKQRLDLSSSSNGHMSTSSSSLTDSRFIDPNTGDLATVVAQLKDQVALLNKRLQLKEKELLSKDQQVRYLCRSRYYNIHTILLIHLTFHLQIADLKSTNAREQRELREKINSLQKQHTERVSEMQAKLVAMQKQIAAQTKTSRTNPTSGYIEPPMVI